jgi:RNA polymerase subunit RPABC4/transcription elongation factor Spt4
MNEEQIRYCNQCRFQLFPEDKICPNCKNKDFNEPKSNEDNEFL